MSPGRLCWKSYIVIYIYIYIHVIFIQMSVPTRSKFRYIIYSILFTRRYVHGWKLDSGNKCVRGGRIKLFVYLLAFLSPPPPPLQSTCFIDRCLFFSLFYHDARSLKTEEIISLSLYERIILAQCSTTVLHNIVPSDNENRRTIQVSAAQNLERCVIYNYT